MISYTLVLTILILTLMKSTTDIHRLQLNGYYVDQYFKWYGTHKNKWMRPYELVFATGIALVALTNHPITWIIGGVCLLLHLYFYKLIRTAEPKKKPIVYTPKVKRLLMTETALFILMGIAMQLTSSYALFICLMLFYWLSPVWVVLAHGINIPIEQRVNRFYTDDAKKILAENPDLIVIGITGSYGKTSTKNVLYSMLSKDFNVLMTPESYNTTMGVTRAIRSDLKPIHQIFIAEMGAKKTGDIKEICELVNPHYGIITSIGPQHLDTFKTFDNIVKTKGELFAYLQSGGTAFVNLEDENIVNQPKRSDLNYVHFTANDKKGKFDIAPDYYIEAISINASGSSFTLVHGPTSKKVRLNTKLLGRHNLQNIIAGAAVALSLGVKMERLNSMIADLEPVKHRLSTRRVADLYTVLDDAFNSNPVGSKMALEVLGAYEGNKKIIITPGMIELGDQFYDLNKKFGEAMASVCDRVILVGKKQTQPIYDGLMAQKYNEKNIIIVPSVKVGFEELSRIVEKDDVVLIENDLPDTFNE